MKPWKKRWREELDGVIPTMSEELKNTPIETVEACEEPVSPKKTWYTQAFAFITSRKGMACAAACAVCLTVAGLSLHFFRKPNQPITASAENVIAVEVNPKAVFSVDENGKVTAVVAANEDADVVLSENRDGEMEGKTVAEAAKIFVDYTAQLGYIDLSKPDAVRVSACESEDWLGDVSSALEGYFQDKNAYVAVASETVSLSDFCNRIGFEITSSLNSLKESIEALPTLVFEREAEGKNVEELKNLYKGRVPAEDIENALLGGLRDNIEKIEKNVADISAIAAISGEILLHEDNPKLYGVIPLDYWTLSESEREEEYTDAFAALMEEMGDLLSAYEADYGKQITGLPELEEVKNALEKIPLDTLNGLLEEFTVELFSEQFSALVELLKTVGLDTSWIDELCSMPENSEEYVAKVKSNLTDTYGRLLEEHKDKYSQVRESVEKADYEAYIDRLVAEYGSLNAYWESLQNL